MSGKPNRVLAKAAAMIAVLAERGALSPAEIAELINVARPSVYRLAEGTSAIGLTEPTDDSRIRLSMRWLHLADSVAEGMPEWRDAQPVLDAVAHDTGQTAFLSVPRPREAVCIAWAPGRGIDLLALKPGRSLPLHAGAAGRSILANSPQLVANLSQLAPFPQLTVRTLISIDELLADVIRSRETGFTVSDQDVTIGIGAVGVPILDEDQLLGCVSVGGLAEDIARKTPELVVALRAAAVELRSSALQV